MDEILEKRCPVCQGWLKLLHRDAYLQFDTPLTLFPDGLSMNVYECESCHRLEFYNCVPTAPQQADADEMVVCPDCGQEHSKYINCPFCAMSGRRKSADSDVKKKDGKKTKAPWEF